ncbi:Uncharacterised protein [Mycobacteroides abscessus subsp. abscessus]|nr:Uncharacterised protein [Mycobacteroides abscessus subsp. abscessus]
MGGRVPERGEDAFGQQRDTLLLVALGDGGAVREHDARLLSAERRLHQRTPILIESGLLPQPCTESLDGLEHGLVVVGLEQLGPAVEENLRVCTTFYEERTKALAPGGCLRCRGGPLSGADGPACAHPVARQRHHLVQLVSGHRGLGLAVPDHLGLHRRDDDSQDRSAVTLRVLLLLHARSEALPFRLAFAEWVRHPHRCKEPCQLGSGVQIPDDPGDVLDRAVTERRDGAGCHRSRLSSRTDSICDTRPP